MILPSWREGRARLAVIEFLERTRDLEVEKRVAVFDNDGTLWCEKPNYIQLDFFVDELRRRTHERPDLADRPEYGAVLRGDVGAMAQLGMERIALALVDLFNGQTPAQFEERAREFITNAIHPDHGVPYARMVYQPMLELLDLLRDRGFSTFIVSGGGAEFLRAVSRSLYGVDPDGVVGSLVAYEFTREKGGPVLHRTSRLYGEVNEGAAKVSNIQAFLGRRPIFAAGNSAGDTEMLEYAAATDGNGLALLVAHDDPEREYSYASEAGTFAEREPILDTAKRLGWTVASMREDWSGVFAGESPRTRP